MRKRNLTILLVLSLPLFSFLCPATDTNADNPCSREREEIFKDTAIRLGGTYYLEAPPAMNDCHAIYSLVWRYLDDAEAFADPSMPPLENLQHAFGPAGEFSYFPHSIPVLTKNELGQHVWLISASVGNKNSGYPSTEHSISVSVPTEQEDPKARSVMIEGLIEYNPVQD